MTSAATANRAGDRRGVASLALAGLMMILGPPGGFARTPYWDAPAGTDDAVSGGPMPERHETLAESKIRWATLSGRAKVIDGDTIVIRGWHIGLDAIDAPESGQSCEADGRGWRCGEQAARALADKIGTASVTCAERGNDSDGHTLALCTLGELNLNRWLVAEGWALADRCASMRYVAQEDAARAAGNGIWRGRFVPPWDWRRGVRLADAEPGGGECPSEAADPG